MRLGRLFLAFALVLSAGATASVAGTLSLLVLKVIPLMHWLRLFATDYDAGVLYRLRVP